jgi:hypothetical protein
MVPTLKGYLFELREGSVMQDVVTLAGFVCVLEDGLGVLEDVIFREFFSDSRQYGLNNILVRCVKMNVHKCPFVGLPTLSEVHAVVYSTVSL